MALAHLGFGPIEEPSEFRLQTLLRWIIQVVDQVMYPDCRLLILPH